MTPYRFDNKEKKVAVSRTRAGIVVFAVLIIIVVVLFVVAPFLKTVTSGPAWLARKTEEVALTTVSTLTPKSVLIQEIKNLKDTLAEQEALVIENEQIKEENEALKKELSYTPAVEQLLGAQVIGKPNQSLFNTLIIDRGSNQGVQLGQLVLAERSLGIGRVVGVSPTTATVELFGAPHFEGDVILAHKGVTVPAKGKGSGNFEIHIPREIAVADGDLLSFPEKPSIVIGVVKSVIFDPRDPFQTVLARLPVNVQELRFVEVLQ